MVVQFLVVRHGRAGDSFPPPRPGPAGSAPTTAPHRRSQEAGRRRRRPPVRSFPLARPPRPPLPGRPLLSRARTPQQLGRRQPRGRRRRQRRRNVLPAERGWRPRSEGPAPRPRPSPPARSADWPAGLRRAWPIKRGDGERGAEAQKARGRESLGQERARAEGLGRGGASRGGRNRRKAERGRPGSGRGGQGAVAPFTGCRGSLGCCDSRLRSFLLRCYLRASFTLEGKEVCPSSTRGPKRLALFWVVLG